MRETALLFDTYNRAKSYWVSGIVVVVVLLLPLTLAAFDYQSWTIDLFQDAPIGVFRTTADGGVEFANLALAQKLGFSTPEEAVTYYHDLGTQLYADPQRRVEFVEKMRRDGSVSGFEYEALTYDGRRVWMNMYARLVIRPETGDYVIEGFVSDITQRKQAEAALASRTRMFIAGMSLCILGLLGLAVRLRFNIARLRDAESELAREAARMKIFMEESRDGIVVLDHEGKVYQANKNFAQMLGYSMEAVHCLSVFDWEALASPEKIKRMIAAVDDTGDFFETQHRRKDGSVFDVEISSNAVWINGHKLVFCVCRDITARKKAEEELTALYDDTQRMNALMQGREDRIIELKAEVNILSQQTGKGTVYASVEDEV